LLEQKDGDVKMKKQFLFLFVVLSLIAVPLLAEKPDRGMTNAAHFIPASKTIKLEISGSAIPLADPLAGPFPIMAHMEGSGNIGYVSSQGMYLCNRLVIGGDGRGDLEVLEGQNSFRLKINGDVLLGISDSGITGWLQITDPVTGSAVWEQTFTGRIVGGTGRFAGIKGTYKKSIKGFSVLFTEYGPASAVVQPFKGTLEIKLER
jgi:hypothetical protein